jgi:hyperosmotically inducible periplasmic protein
MNNAMHPRQVLIATVSAMALLATAGCAVTRHQESIGAYIDDATVTASVKHSLADDPAVSAAAISVETLQGTVQLSGFAKSEAEKAAAERDARAAKGVLAVRNDIVVHG